MLYRREGFPEEGELVLCTVTAVNPSSVFCKLDEYEKSGLINISEVSPGRIRNIRDFVSEGRKIVCLVLKVDEAKGHIDLSLRRVTESQRREKTNAIKQEMRAESIIENTAKRLKIPVEKLYKEISSAILKDYEYIHQVFEDIAEGKIKIESLSIKKEYADILKELILEKIKSKEVTISGKLELSTYAGDGVEIIKDTFAELLNNYKNLNVRYLGGGKYLVEIKASEYKDAEKILKKVLDTAENRIKKTEGGVFNFVRE